MKQFLVLLFSAVTFATFAQDWREYIIDDNLTLSLPENYTITDTMSQRVIMAQTDHGFILVTRMKNDGQNEFSIRDEAALIKRYREFRKGLMKSTKGKVIREEVFEKDGLKYWKFSYTAPWGDVEKQVRHSMILFLNQHIYTFSIWEQSGDEEKLTAIREKLFSSVKVPDNATLKNQLYLTKNDSGGNSEAYRTGELFGTAVFWAGVVFLFVFSIRRLSKRSRRK